jgi:GNAT superfamily N-acetyltransferase
MGQDFTIRPLTRDEIPLLKCFPPGEWHFDMPAFLGQHFGEPYLHTIVAERNGAIAGCGNAWIAGAAGWLGNIIVLPEHRGRGIGRATTRSLMDYVRSRGCGLQLLIATELGRPVYEKEGFRETGRYVFLKGPAFKDVIHQERIRPARPSDRGGVISLDREATGEDRSLILVKFLTAGVVYEKNGVVGGFCLPEFAHGPVIARDPDAGLALLSWKHHHLDREPVIPEGNVSALGLLKERGYVVSKSAPRMAIGPDTRWKQEMIFGRAAGYCG